MTSITFHGGVGEIGGNKILLEEGNTKILLDFGPNFTRHGEYFSEFLKPRKSHSLEDFLELGFLPDLEGIYRKDYMKHLGKEVKEGPEIDAVFITHAHLDHIGYLHFLRRDIPIYCSPTTKVILKCRQECGSGKFKEYHTFKERFKLREYANKPGLTRITGRTKGFDPEYEREIKTIEDGDNVKVGQFDVKGSKVCHSLPGAMGYLIESKNKKIVYTGDLRLHGYCNNWTKEFIERAENFDPDLLITEATKINGEEEKTEKEVKSDLENIVEETDGLALVNFPKYDLERMLSVYRAAVNNNRRMVISPKQAFLLQRLSESDILEFNDLDPENSEIKILLPNKGWETRSFRLKDIDGEWKPIEEINTNEENKKNLIQKDYRDDYVKRLVGHEDCLTPEDIRKNQGDYVVYCDYYKLTNLIDLKPQSGTFIRSKTEPFTQEMEIDDSRIENWIKHFGLDRKMAHASGHLFSEEIKGMIERIDPDTVIPVHTEAPEKIEAEERQLMLVETGKGYQI